MYTHVVYIYIHVIYIYTYIEIDNVHMIQT